MAFFQSSRLFGHDLASLRNRRTVIFKNMILPGGQKRTYVSVQTDASKEDPGAQDTRAYRAMVCVTTCRRLDMVRAFAPEFMRFCAGDERFDFLLALDGREEGYLKWCRQSAVPLSYSDEREGVGLSKNRVLTRFPNYDYFFFVEDDVELLDASYFEEQVGLAQQTGLPHFSLHERRRLQEVQDQTRVGNRTILHAQYGSAQVNFFSAPGLARVGGWDPVFAKYRRWGHTEQSYRFVHAGLCTYPFNVVEEFIEGYFEWHNPHSIVGWPEIPANAYGVSEVEVAVIAARRDYVPLQTLSAHHVNEVARKMLALRGS